VHVLVTGANGFVGRHLCKHLREHGDRVTEANGPGAPGAVDVTDAAAVRAALEAARPEAVVHLAGFSSVGKSYRDPVQAFAVNAMGTVHLLVAAHDVAPKARLLLVASAEVYGSVPEGARATEDFPVRPLSPYAAAKAAAELAGFQFHRASGLEVISARPFNHIGSGQEPSFVVPSFARQVEAIRGGRAEPSLQVGDVSVVRDFSHVGDVVEAYRLLLARGTPGEAYNVCGGEGRTIRSILDELLRLAAVRADVSVDPQRLRSAEIPRLVGDPSKLRALGWRPTRTVTDALREALDEARGA
jgi:GDP-4-dehydro-6-deoxy-D-mannose reductase